jgi:hypothetical protein
MIGFSVFLPVVNWLRDVTDGMMGALPIAKSVISPWED